MADDLRDRHVDNCQVNPHIDNGATISLAAISFGVERD